MVKAERGSDRDSVQVIGRAASVLRCVANANVGLSLSEISHRTGLARSTVQRIVKSLEDEFFLEPASARGGYVLGHGLLSLSSQTQIDVVAAAEPFLRELASLTGETVDLSILDEGSALFVAQIAGTHRLAAQSSVGARFPLHSTANGKALLACLRQEDARRLIGVRLLAETKPTAEGALTLTDQIAAAKVSGIAFDHEEQTEGICAVGSAVFDKIGKPYAISIPVPTQRYHQISEVLILRILACAKDFAAHLGGRPLGT